MFKALKKICPPAWGRHQAATTGHHEADVGAYKKAVIALEHEERSKAAAQHLRAYTAHVKSVDLNGIATRNGRALKLSASPRPGEPLRPSELGNEVKTRLQLAQNAGLDLQINLADGMPDKDIADITRKLDKTALDWLWRHQDPEGQRTAATAVFRGLADLERSIPLDLYVMIVAESVARSHAQMRPAKILVAVGVRAILLRSADPRWTRRYRSELRPLSEPHW